MTDLSPAAQAVMDAAETGLDGYIELLPPTWKSSIAAALRAAADQVVPESTTHHLGEDWVRKIQREQRAAIRLELLAIANELAQL